MLILPRFANDEVSHALRALGRESEQQRACALLEQYQSLATRLEGAEDDATLLIERIREKMRYSAGINALLNEYSLSSKEGVVLMCLAEALLRVPDKLTADRLIRDKLGEGDWHSHVGQSRSMFVNASAWGLLLTGKFIEFREEDAVSAWKTLKQTVGRVGEPAIRASMRLAMRIMGTQFVLGRDIDEALDRSKEWQQRGYRYSYDMLGEGARTDADAETYFDHYVLALKTIGKHRAQGDPVAACGISIKLSALHPRFHLAQMDRIRQELAPRLLELAKLAREDNIGLTIDAEESDRLEPAMAVFEAVYADPSLADWDGLGLVVQAYLKRAPAVIDWLSAQHARHGKRIMVRLVKGAYWDAEIKLAQTLGHDSYPVYTRKASSDVSYLVCAEQLLARRDHLYPQFATHNAHSAAAIMRLAGDDQGFEFQRLHGMGEELFEELLEHRGSKVPCRIYAPVGVHRDLLAYLVRRLLENGANSSFVNNIANDNVPARQLARDPGAKLAAYQHLANPGIPLPADIFPDARKLAFGDDLDDPDELQDLANSIRGWQACRPGVGCDADTPDAVKVTNPARRSEIVGYYQEARSEDMEATMAACAQGFAAWSARAPEDRADCLRRAADLIEARRAELIAYCVHEAGKTVADSLADVREAVDFCRYYAQQAEELYRDHGNAVKARGTVLCISPWNFPVAIFAGQVAAALAVGNTVIAKPAEQTTLVGLRIVQLLHEAGIPKDALCVLTGRGEPIGDALLPDPRINAVMFTGSTEVAQLINRRLAARDDAPLPLIAETGGQNALVVDSTALPEQVVDDVVNSGFNSAGQRCSALRVLLVQEDIADNLLTMLTGAMRELHVGNPANIATDVGPVIDTEAQQRLQQHADAMDSAGKLLYACEAGAECADGSFFAPRLYQIDSLEQLSREVFGPVVHVLRYKAQDLDELAQRINATGFGLTFGVHSRIEDSVEQLSEQVEVGNVYVNRNIIGAVVGVQPFGGHGLSGTGPKAGGPLYLPRLLQGLGGAAAGTAAVASTAASTAAAASIDLPTLSALLATEQQTWRYSAPEQRLGALIRLQDLVARRADIDTSIGAALLEAISSLELQYRSLMQPRLLPGPTGEINTLQFPPRGTILVMVDTDTGLEAVLWMCAAALITGNAVLLGADHGCRERLMLARNLLGEAGFPDGVSALALVADTDLEQLAASAPLAAVATASAALAGRAARALADRDGAILPVISESPGPLYLARFVSEKTMSVNITASGGNAVLLSQQESD